MLIELKHASTRALDLLHANDTYLEELNFSISEGESVALESPDVHQTAQLVALLCGELPITDGTLQLQKQMIAPLHYLQYARQISNHNKRLPIWAKPILGQSVSANLNLVFPHHHWPSWVVVALEKTGLFSKQKLRTEQLTASEQYMIAVLQLAAKAKVLIVEKWPDILSIRDRKILTQILMQWAAVEQTGWLCADMEGLEELLPNAYFLDNGHLLNAMLDKDPAKGGTKTHLRAILTVDAQQRLLSTNYKARKILGQQLVDSLGTPLDKLLTWERQDRSPVTLKELLAQSAEQKDHSTQEGLRLIVYNLEGEPIQLQFFIQKETRENQITKWILSFDDISKQAENNRIKTDFVGIVGHELRTPLTSVDGNLQLFRMSAATKLSDQENGMLESIQTGVKRLQTLVNNLLRIASDDMGTSKLHLSRASLAMLVRTTALPYRDIAHSQGINLTMDLSKDAQIDCDEVRLIEVVENLLVNALDNTPQGGEITLTLKHDKNHRQIRCEVSNTGKPIPHEIQKHLFTLFYRAPQEKQHTNMHLGLGLYLARKIVEQHQGEVFVTSDNHGTNTFGFSLPAFF